MNLKELSTKLGYSENTFKRSFNRTCETLKKNKGIIITKTGYGNTADYIITYDDSLIEKKSSKQQIHTELVGQRFGNLIVLKDSGERFHRGVVWTCQCDCGNIKNIPGIRLKNGHAKSCGDEQCKFHHYYDDLTGQKFGKLTVIKPTSMKDGTRMYWLCKCDCGNTYEVSGSSLKNGTTRSCGCIKSSIGEDNIRNILTINNIKFKEQITFSDLKNKKPLRFDFGIYNNNNTLIRLIEFDGIQHYQPQEYFSHSFEENKINDEIKNDYCKNKNIPLVRIPYWERDKITLSLLLGEEYLI